MEFFDKRLTTARWKTHVKLMMMMRGGDQREEKFLAT